MSNSYSTGCSSCGRERILYPRQAGFCGACIQNMDFPELLENFAEILESPPSLNIRARSPGAAARPDRGILAILVMAKSIATGPIGSGELFDALLSYPDSQAVLAAHGVDRAKAINARVMNDLLRRSLNEEIHSDGLWTIPANSCQQVASALVANNYNRRQYNTRDLLAAMSKERSSVAGVVLGYLIDRPIPFRPATVGQTGQTQREEGTDTDTDTDTDSDPLDTPPFIEELPAAIEPELPTRPETPVLNELATNISAQAEQGLLDPVIGRAAEIAEMTEVLIRRRKNNAILVGAPGVGKTAVAQGLAQEIAGQRLPALADYQVFQLDLTAIVAGTKMRGEFEQRLRNIISESEADGKIILFIDEIHTIVGAGASEGALDISNILKPALSSGLIRVVGTTTEREYRLIERDAALARRFSRIDIKEPSLAEAETIITGLADRYARAHNVEIDQEAIHAAVVLSDRYLTNNQLPDKAIDLIDQAAAMLRVRDPQISEQKNLGEQIEKLIEQIDPEGPSQAELNEQLNRLEAKVCTVDNRLVAADIAELVARQTNFSAGDISLENVSVASLRTRLGEHIVGHPEVLDNVSAAISSSIAGLADPDCPVGAFLFTGPSGVGKTEVAKAIAREMVNEDALIRLDMSEYSSAHSVNRLYGSPPGYVGYGRGGELTNAVRKQPHAILLLDEIEKAHPEVWNALLQVLDDGRMTDGEGAVIDFSHTIVIMTSNVGSGATDRRRPGFQSDEDVKAERSSFLGKEIRRVFPAEFLNRLQVEQFAALESDQLELIAEKMIAEIVTRVARNRQIELVVDPSVAEAGLAGLKIDPAYGARPLKRILNNLIERPLTESLLDRETVAGSRLTIKMTGSGIRISRRLPRRRSSRIRLDQT